MEERKGILDYAAQVLLIFGLTMMIMMVFVMLFGEDAQDFSKMFVLGKAGLSVGVMAEYFILAVLVVALRYFFFTDRFLKKMSVLVRTICMVLAILGIIVVFIIVFGWFPVHMWQPWVMFLLCFLLCFVCSMAISVWKTKQENQRLEEGLSLLRKQWEEEEET